MAQLDQTPLASSQPYRSRYFGFGISLLIVLGLWQTLASLLRLPNWLLPTPFVIARRWNLAIQDGTLWQHSWPTIIESVLGFGLALVAATLLGYWLAHSRRMARWLAPYLAAFQSVPVIAIAPLLVVWWNGSDLSRSILVAAVVMFFPMFSATLTGIRSIPRELREVAIVEGATLIQRVRYLEFPVALPVLFSGMRTSLAYATTGAVVAEFIGARYGLGAMINIARGMLDTPLLFVALGCLVLITLCFYGILVALEHLLLGWYEAA